MASPLPDSFWISLPGIIAAFFAGIAALKSHSANKRGAENKNAIVQTQKQIEEVKHEVNGKMKEYVDATKAASKAEGKQEAQDLTDKEKLAAAEAKLQTIEQQKKEDALKSAPPDDKK